MKYVILLFSFVYIWFMLPQVSALELRETSRINTATGQIIEKSFYANNKI